MTHVHMFVTKKLYPRYMRTPSVGTLYLKKKKIKEDLYVFFIDYTAFEFEKSNLIWIYSVVIS